MSDTVLPIEPNNSSIVAVWIAVLMSLGVMITLLVALSKNCAWLKMKFRSSDWSIASKSGRKKIVHIARIDEIGSAYDNKNE